MASITDLIETVESTSRTFLRPAARRKDAHRAACARCDAGLHAVEGRGVGAQPRRRRSQGRKRRSEREPDDRPSRCHRGAVLHGACGWPALLAQPVARAPGGPPRGLRDLLSASWMHSRSTSCASSRSPSIYRRNTSTPASIAASAGSGCATIRRRRLRPSRASCAPARTVTMAASPSSRPRIGPAACRCRAARQLARRAACVGLLCGQYRRHAGALDQRPLGLDAPPRRQPAGRSRCRQPPSVGGVLSEPELRRGGVVPAELRRHREPTEISADHLRRPSARKIPRHPAGDRLRPADEPTSRAAEEVDGEPWRPTLRYRQATESRGHAAQAHFRRQSHRSSPIARPTCGRRRRRPSGRRMRHA